MKRLWAAGLGLFLVALIVQFPAAWLAPVVSRATSERWRLADARGTVWHGRAALYSYDRGTGYWSAGRALDWRIAWQRVARGQLAAVLDFDDGGKAQLAAGMTGWSLEGVDVRFPAAQLAVLLPGTVGDYGWGGTIAARASAFRCAWDRRACSGQVDLTWEEATTAQISGPPLGNYTVRLTAEGDALRFALGTLNGRLQLNGRAEILGGRLQFTGDAAVTEADARLDSLLRAIGRPGPVPGRYLIEYRETAPGPVSARDRGWREMG